MTHNSPIERRGHMGKHPIRCGLMCPLRIALTLGPVAHATSGVKSGGEGSLWPSWAKRPKFTQERSLQRSCLRIARERSLGLLHGCKPKLCFPFATRVEVQSTMKAFLTPQSLKHTIYGKKCIYRRYWHEHILGTLRSKNMSKHFWSRPIVGAFKYAPYG